MIQVLSVPTEENKENINVQVHVHKLLLVLVLLSRALINIVNHNCGKCSQNKASHHINFILQCRHHRAFLAGRFFQCDHINCTYPLAHTNPLFSFILNQTTHDQWGSSTLYRQWQLLIYIPTAKLQLSKIN